MELYITRHGESATAPKGERVFEMPLSEKGELQAKLLGERLASIKLDCIISSPLMRALQTANAVATRQSPCSPVELLPDIMEVGTDDSYPGRPLDELFRLCPTTIAPSCPTAAGGTLTLLDESNSHSKAMLRAQRVIAYLRQRFTGDEKVLLAAHGSFNSLLIAAAIGIDCPSGFNFSQDNTGLTLVRYIIDNGEPRTKLAFMNDISHMYGIISD